MVIKVKYLGDGHTKYAELTWFNGVSERKWETYYCSNWSTVKRNVCRKIDELARRDPKSKFDLEEKPEDEEITIDTRPSLNSALASINTSLITVENFIQGDICEIRQIREKVVQLMARDDVTEKEIQELLNKKKKFMGE